MSAYEILISSLGTFLGLLGLWRLPLLWQNRIGWNPDEPPVYWRWGLGTWRGLVRTNVAVVFVFVSFVPGYVLESAGADGTWAEIVTGVSLGLCVSIGLLMVSVFLFNAPRWMVAPHLRHQHGAIAEWSGRRSQPTGRPG